MSMMEEKLIMYLESLIHFMKRLQMQLDTFLADQLQDYQLDMTSIQNQFMVSYHMILVITRFSLLHLDMKQEILIISILIIQVQALYLMEIGIHHIKFPMKCILQAIFTGIFMLLKVIIQQALIKILI